MQKCVVTGIGSVCSVGNNVKEVWENIIGGKCGVKEIKSFKTDKCYTHVSAEIEDFKPNFQLASKYINKMDRVSVLCIEAALEAVKDSALDIESQDMSRVGVVVASCAGGLLSLEKYHKQYLDNPQKCKPIDLLKVGVSPIVNNVALAIGNTGISTSIANACAAGTIGIAYACSLIESGVLDVAIVCGADTSSSLTFGGFHSIKALAVEGCSPFSRSDGINLGEGAGAIIIESRLHAEKREKNAYASIAGYAVSSDAYHITAPHPEGEGQINAMEKAMKEADLKPLDIDYINAHGTATPLNDGSEKAAIDKVFKDSKDKLMISSTKSMTGHCLGAAGVLEAIFTIKALKEGAIPPTINFDTKLESDYDFVPNHKKNKDINIAMSNSLAFGGNNASVIFTNKNLKKENNMPKFTPVAVTGIGIVSPIGVGIDEYWNNIKNGKSGIKSEIDSYGNHRNIAIVDEIDYEKYDLSPEILRKLDRQTKMVLVSGQIAFKDADIDTQMETKDDIGIILGSSEGPIEDTIKFQERLIKKGIHAGSPLIFPNTVYNVAAGFLSILKKTKGYTATFANGFMSGINSIFCGYDLVNSGKQKIAFVAGADEYSQASYHGYNSLKSLYTKDSDFKGAYNFTQKGFVLGEGCTGLILESLEDAKRKQSKIYAQILGFGFSTQALSPGKVNTQSYGLDQAILNACDNAGIKLSEIDDIVGFANGSALIDSMEMDSYNRIFKERIKMMSITSIKDFVGEGRAATSALQVAHACLMLYNKEEQSITKDRYILVTSFSFGGGYSAVILKG